MSILQARVSRELEVVRYTREPLATLRSVCALERSCWHSPLQKCSRRSFRCQAALGIILKSAVSGTITLDQESIRIGSSEDSDVRLTGANIAPQHAVLQRGRGRTTCTALVGDADDLFSDTFTFLDGNQLRKDVAYLLQSGSTLSFGEISNEFVVEFEEQAANNAALEMLVQGMASQASKEVREQLDI